MDVRYYRILGISDNATIEDIKKAYRQKAKELHPDINKKADAHEQFILLTEAYEYLINLRTGKIRAGSTSYYDDWEINRREEARQRAAEYARMKYEEFINSDYYKKSQAAFVILDHFYFFSSILIIIGFPTLGFIFYGIQGIFIGLVFVIFSFAYWGGIFREKTHINIKSLLRSLNLIIITKAFWYIALTLLNVFMLFRFTLNTEVSTLVILLTLVVLISFAYHASHLINRMGSLPIPLFSFCIIPFVFNLFFVINFVFSSHPTQETYSFIHQQTWYPNEGSPGKDQYEKIAYIDLEGNKYKENHWFRYFTDFESMKDANTITYTFKNGLFGFRVLKSYKFKTLTKKDFR